MDSLWFKEDRKLPKEEQDEAIEDSKKALLNSTFMSRRLTQILKDKYEECLREEEKLPNDANWLNLTVASQSRRKTLREILKLLPTQEDLTNV